MELLATRIISILCLLVMTLFFGTLPYWAILKRKGNSVSPLIETIIRYLNCFTGGVFLGALFLHLMTEGSEEFEKYLVSVHYDSDYPFFNIIIMVGFFLTSTIEYVAHLILAKEEGITSLRHMKTNQHSQREESHRNDHDNGGYGTMASVSVVMTTSQELSRADPKESSAECERVFFHGHSCLSQENQALPVPTACDTTFNIRGVILFLALSFHSIFDGLALGLQEEPSTIWEIFAAVLLHKCIVAFCMGLDIFTTFPSIKIATLMMTIFSFISPLGASIGIIMTSGRINEHVKLLSSGIMQALSCGAFLYITFLEILNKYWKGSGCQQSIFDILFSFIGLVIMAILKIWA